MIECGCIVNISNSTSCYSFATCWLTTDSSKGSILNLHRWETEHSSCLFGFLKTDCLSWFACLPCSTESFQRPRFFHSKTTSHSNHLSGWLRLVRFLESYTISKSSYSLVVSEWCFELGMNSFFSLQGSSSCTFHCSPQSTTQGPSLHSNSAAMALSVTQYWRS